MLLLALIFIVFLFFWCEFGIYYVHLALTCGWPSGQARAQSENEVYLKALVLSDTHLLGTVRGHWFDKLRREWQMYRSFQSAMTLFSPSVVFFLGDLFDEGQWASGGDFKKYVERFKTLFHVPSSCKLYVVTGNHDIGFHSRTNRFLNDRFDRAMNTSPVDLLSFPSENVYLVRLNSMAMENDGCFLCHQAIVGIEKIAKQLGELRRKSVDTGVYPVLLTHFPLFRLNESICSEGDSAPANERFTTHRSGLDCFSKPASNYLLERLKPRLILNGHVHHSCSVNHTVTVEGNDDVGSGVANLTIPEWTVASFSWRNKVNPSFLLLELSKSDHRIRKCFLPNETVVILTYVLSCTLLLIMLVLIILSKTLLIKGKRE